MRDPRPDLIDASAARKRSDLKGLLLVAAISLALAFIADAVTGFSPLATPAMPHAQGRAWSYAILGYGLLVPVSMVLQRSSMRRFTLRKGDLPDRIFLLVLCVCLALPGFFLPEALLAFGHGLVGRSGSLYRGMMNSRYGLALIGTFLFYGAAAFAWFLSIAVSHVFPARDGRETLVQVPPALEREQGA